MNDDTKSRVVSLLMPCFDSGLLLLVIIFGTAGLSWLTNCPSIHASDPTRPDMSADEIQDRISMESLIRERFKQKQDRATAEMTELERKLREARERASELATLEAERDALARETAKTAAEIKRVEEQLQRLNDEIAHSQSKRDTLRAERDTLAERLAELQAQLAELKKKQRSLTKEMEDIRRLSRKVDDVDAKLKEATKEIAKLRDEIAEHLNPSDAKVFLIEYLPRYRVDTERKAVVILINQGTVTPLRRPYYTLKTVDGVDTAVLTIRGEDAAQSLAAGSAFSELTDGIDSDRQFVVLFVDSVSFETFRAIRAALKERNIDVGWEPSEAENFRFGAGGRDVNPQ